jgi:hypothetical protein
MLKTEAIKRPAQPGQFAICRNLADGDWAAAALLHRIVGLWLYREEKKVKFLNRLGMDWIAMSRSDWAISAGLSDAEMKDRALPRLKKKCSSFVTIRTMRLSPSEPNLIWVSLDREAMSKAITPWDMYGATLNGQGIFAKAEAYPYKEAE